MDISNVDNKTTELQDVFLLFKSGMIFLLMIAEHTLKLFKLRGQGNKT